MIETEVTNKDLFTELQGTEVESLRSSQIKHFALGAGRYQAITYPLPVHYNANGASGDADWRDIDNTLVSSNEPEGAKAYSVKANDVQFSLPVVLDATTPVSYTDENGNALDWLLENAQPSEGVVTDGRTLIIDRLAERAVHMPQYVGLSIEALRKRDLITDMLNEEEQRSELPLLQSRVTYKDVLPGVTLSYTVYSRQLKFSFTVEDPTALEKIALLLPDVYDYKTTASAISISDKRTGKCLFTILPPYVYDAKRKEIECNAVLTKSGEYYRLTYNASDTTIDGSPITYPITIDPVVKTTTLNTDVEDTYIWLNNPNTNYSTVYTMRCGLGSGGESITLVRFKKLVSIKASDTIIQARLRLTATDYGSSEEYMAVYPIKTDWDESTVTWNSMTPNDDTHISTDMLAYIVSTTGSRYFDITETYRSWYLKKNGVSQNLGVAVRYPAGLDYTDKYVQWASTEYDNVYGPCMYVNYVSHAGRQGWWPYESMSAGRAGAGYVDLYNGNLIFEHGDGGTTGSRMPVSISHIYNSCLSATDNLGCGRGWRTSMHQSVNKQNLGGSNYYVWTDGSGTDHYFKISGDQPYKDSEGMSLKLTTGSGKLKITDKGHNVMQFTLPTDTTAKLLESVTDAHGNTATCAYTNGMLATVTDGVGREITYAYTDGKLTSLTIPGCPVLTFTYTGDLLTGISYADVVTGGTVYEYASGTALLTKATNYDGISVNVGFEANTAYDSDLIANYSQEARRVITLEQTGSDSTGAEPVIIHGAKQLFSYKYMTTEVTVVENTVTDDGKTLTYVFNDAGNVVCVYDELGFACGNTWSAIEANQVESSSKLHKSATNLLQHIDFSSGWTAVKGTSSDVVTRASNTRCLGLLSMYIKKTASAESLYRQQVSVEAGTYVFSAYVKNSTALTSGGLFLRITNGNTVFESRKITDETTPYNVDSAADGWDRLYVSAAIPTAGTINVEFVSTAPSGTSYFAVPQLEVGTIPSHVNLLQNTEFRRTTTVGSQTFAEQWDKNTGITTEAENGVISTGLDLPEGLSGNAMRIKSRCDRQKCSHYQTINATGKKGDIFVFGGWFNITESVASGNTHFKPAMLVYFFKDGGGSTDVQYLEVEPQRTGWKYAQWAVAAPEAYTGVRVGFQYARNNGCALFTNLFVYREEFGRSYAYDENNNLVSTATLSQQKSAMQYDDADNMTSYRQPGAASSAKYTMTYGSTSAQRKKHLLLTSTTPQGVKHTYTYDSYGNQLTDTNQKASSNPLIKATATYTADGNYPSTQTDARGNVVSQVINSTDGTRTSVTDPAGQTVSYTYDSAKRVTGVQAIVGNDTYSNAYTYENDRIKTVGHNTSGSVPDVTYTFSYDKLGRKTEVHVGSQLLSRNTYTTDRSSLLSQVYYGNGQHVNYTYDSYDRMTGVRFNGETAPRYTYEYGSDGGAEIVRDSNLGRTLQTERDLSGRPIGTELRDTTGVLLYETRLEYDKQNRLTGFCESAGNGSYKSKYAYDTDNRVTSIGYGNVTTPTHKVSYTYDTLGRISSSAVECGNSSSGKNTITYTYVAGGHGTNSTTPLVAGISQTKGISFSYTYDSRSNIISETRGSLTTTYEYDAIGQLTRVNDPHENATWVYAYDRGGNILSKTKYAYTTGDLTGLTPVQVIPYTYNSTWKDLLASYDGVTLTHDTIGNLTNDGTWTYNWQAGRQLAGMSSTGKSIAFAYDHNGLRTQKAVTENGVTVTTDYMLHGKLVTHLTRGTDSLHFYYDAASKPIFVEYNGTMYAYVHNLQGDIVGILDSNGTLVVEYKYDAWGRPISTTGSMSATLGEINPFRYRGYVYDEETGLYYLSSRYYRPEWGRLISCDIDIDGKSGFVYCYNNPLGYTDVSGKRPNIAMMLEKRKLHNYVVDLVSIVVGGYIERDTAQIRGAGRNGGTGYPDVLVVRDAHKLVWEIKPLTDYGLTTGKAQINRYTNNTGYKPGYPIEIEPFPFELNGQEGMVYITNGSAISNDAGVVYYDFRPFDSQIEYELSYNNGYVHSDDRIRENAVGLICSAICLGIAVLSPIVGDEALAFAAIASYF